MIQQGLTRRLAMASLCLLALSTQCSLSAHGQLTPHQAGYLDAVTDFAAHNDGVTVTTDALQQAIDAAVSQGKGLFLPAGRYLVDGPLNVRIPLQEKDDAQRFVLAGSSIDASQRSVLVLKAGTFPDESAPAAVVHNRYYDGKATTRTYNRIIQSIDIEIEEDNAGAIGLQWRGAEGCAIMDVHINVTGGLAGIREVPASGGATANVSVTGGKFGIDLDGGVASPTPTITDFHLEGQTEACIRASYVRGALVLTGGRLVMNKGVPVYQGRRHNTLAFHFGGCPLLTDCTIAYGAYDPANVIFQFTQADWDVSFHLDNVYVRHAHAVVDHDALVEGNHTGWRHYRQLTYNAGPRKFNPGTFDDGIYVAGKKLSANVRDVSHDADASPAGFDALHSWGKTFPSFETPGVVNVRDYVSDSDNGDWAPAFNRAIDAAEGEAEHVVFVPTGQYALHSCIKMQQGTKLIGVSHHHSELLGHDLKDRRFDGTSDAYADARPMIQTPEDPRADCVLADLGVYAVGPFDGVGHNPEPCGHYGVLWQAGRHSVVRNVSINSRTNNYYRAGFVYRTLNKPNYLALTVAVSPLNYDGFLFSSDSASRFHNFKQLPAGIWVETVADSRRLMARSESPFNTATRQIKRCNFSIAKSSGEDFAVSEIKVANASFDPRGGDDVLISGWKGGVQIAKHRVPIKGSNSPRTKSHTVQLDWTSVDRIQLTSSVMFSIDDIKLNGDLIDFEDVTGEKPGDGVGYVSALYYDPGRDLPISMINHHLVKITGGGKWYNFFKHGDTWMRPTQAYVTVEGNHSPINFYHFHAQHSQNDQKLLLESAHDVSVFGIKTENAAYFLKAIDSDNVRIFGHGGMTNPPIGASHYLFENTFNYQVCALTDEVIDGDECRYCGSGNAILLKTRVGTYDPLVEITADGSPLTANRYDRPILWLQGHPSAAYQTGDLGERLDDSR